MYKNTLSKQELLVFWRMGIQPTTTAISTSISFQQLSTKNCNTLRFNQQATTLDTFMLQT